ITMLFILLYFLASAATVFSDVSVVNPIDNQLPLIARVGTPYSWAFSTATFSTDESGSLTYTATTLPDWLKFDPSGRTFSGTPASGDIGNPAISVTAHDSSSSTPSHFTLCVTDSAPLSVNIPVADQFSANGPSLSSVYPLSPNSAIDASDPALRVPPSWSFSIGFQGNTFKSPSGSLFYDALQADGSALPSWLSFDKDSITFDGYSPASPQTLALALHGSDQEGYTSSTLPFSLVVAAHELTQTSASLPTINITAATTFNMSLTSPSDFSGVLVDGKALQPSDITSLEIDTSHYGSWLKYDEASMTLSGQPPGNLGNSTLPILPVTLSAFGNQTIHTNVSFAIVPSYFSMSTFPAVTSDPGQQVQFDVNQYFTNTTRDDVELTVAYDPAEAGNYLPFNNGTGHLAGTIPAKLEDTGVDTKPSAPHITVTFTAYSYITHSTSHASLTISFTPTSNNRQGGTHPLSAASRARLTLGLGITFGIIGGFVMIGVMLATCRRCARVEDTADGENGGRGWTADERKWYGIGIGSKTNFGIEGGPEYGGKSEESASPRPYAALGLGLRRVAERASSNPASQVSSTGVMRKADFMGKILKDTVRNVSDRYQRGIGKVTLPKIGKPVLVSSSRDPAGGGPQRDLEALPFDNQGAARNAHSALTASPSNSTGGRSVPRRRADFAPPKSPRHIRSDSADSLASNSSVTEAVVKTASRAKSMRSAKTASIGSTDTTPRLGGKPRLVPFTSGARVPTPSDSSSPHPSEMESLGSQGSAARRVASQKAKVHKTGAPKASIDDLATGMHYVRTLGGDQKNASARNSATLDSDAAGADVVPRVLIRANEKFKFKVPVAATSVSSKKARKLEVRMMSGGALPRFLHVDLKGGLDLKQKGAVEFYGVPSAGDLGEMSVGVYVVDGSECVGRVIVEVVGRS
ncbi:hypothetical protein PLICRDRAFT_115336, partial [Plicaturopsis crispa FD-325 SS-3]